MHVCLFYATGHHHSTRNQKKQKQNMSEEYFIHAYIRRYRMHVWLFKHRV